MSSCMRAQLPLYFLEIKLEKGVVTVLDSKQKDPQEYEDMTQMLEK